MSAGDANEIASNAWRYFRVVRGDTTGTTKAEQLQWLRSGLGEGVDAAPVPWLPYAVYRVPKGVFLSQTTLHQQGSIVGMDAASVASVVALGAREGDKVLDLCCCPGMKLKLISELVSGKGGAAPSAGLAIGVDISLPRLYVARSLMSKLEANNTILAFADGTQFDPSVVEADIALRRSPAKQQRWLQRIGKMQTEEAARNQTAIWCSEDIRKSILQTASKRPRDGDQRADTESIPVTIPRMFDCTLVDAECTHDGSLHHIVPTAKAPSSPEEVSAPHESTFQDNLHKYKPNYSLHTEESDTELHSLQYKLLRRGYELTKEDGFVVYSTCSFSEGQNESIVKRFLEEFGNTKNNYSGCVASLVDPFESLRAADPVVYDELIKVADVGINGVGIRLNPSKTCSSFQYIAKIHKKIKS